VWFLPPFLKPLPCLGQGINFSSELKFLGQKGVERRSKIDRLKLKLIF
jgi:hypothetical protein